MLLGEGSRAHMEKKQAPSVAPNLSPTSSPPTHVKTHLWVPILTRSQESPHEPESLGPSEPLGFLLLCKRQPPGRLVLRSGGQT